MNICIQCAKRIVMLRIVGADTRMAFEDDVYLTDEEAVLERDRLYVRSIIDYYRAAEKAEPGTMIARRDGRQGPYLLVHDCQRRAA